MMDDNPTVCRRCGGPTGIEDLLVYHSPSDSLQVTECGQCGAVVRIGGHQW